MLFAQQATAAIANARAHRDEQRAKADLEVLVDTAPVGVVVLDAATGALRSLNREAKRIVAGLHTPGRPVEELLDSVTCRRGDGRVSTLGRPTAWTGWSATCSMRAASARARWRWRPGRPRWGCWWTGRGPRSRAPGGTPSPST